MQISATVCQICQCNGTTVDCSDRNLIDFPVDLPKDVEILNLENNGLEVLQAKDLLGYKNLQGLALSNNSLTTLDDFVFGNLHKLEILNLRFNNLTKIEMNTFSGLSTLTVLNLDQNSIDQIDGDSFKDLTSLKYLNLKGNRLQNFSVRILKPLIKLRNLKIDRKVSNNFDIGENDDDHLVMRISDIVNLTCSTVKNKNDDYQHLDCQNLVVKFKRRRKRRQIAQLETLESNPGQKIQILCRLADRQRIRWYFNDEQMTENLDHNGRLNVRNSMLTIENLKPKDAGVYECRGPSSQVGYKVRLKVKHAPEITVKPFDHYSFEGSRIALNCEAKGYPVPSILWFKDNRPLRETRRQVLENNSTKLTIYPLLREDRGVYACQAINVAGSVRAAASIQIKASAPPKITTAPEHQTIPVGGAASFQCRSVGEPVPKITWRFNGDPIPTIKGHYEVSAQNTLYIYDVRPSDQGYYTCQAVNDIGAMSADAKLTLTEDGPAPLASSTTHLRQPLTRELIVDSIRRATFDIDRAINSTRLNLFNKKLKNPAELLALFRFPSPEAVELARSREIYEQTLRLLKRYISSGLELELDEFKYENFLSSAHLQMIAELSGCNVHHEEPNCDDMCFHNKYRTYDGTCNNLQNPTSGSSYTAFKRLVPPIYENGFDQPVGWSRRKLYHGFPKPNPRRVVNEVVASRGVTDDPNHSHMLMQWGQFLDHDLDFAILSPSIEQFDGGLRCKAACTNSPPCFNIEVPKDDPRIKSLPCIEMERSSAVCGSGETSLFFNKIQPREQINQITSFIDASNIYASTEREALDLRDLFSDHGLLKFDLTSHKQKPFLPFNRDAAMDCRRNRSIEHSVRCFLAGDHRANEQLGLLAMHTLWLREHNRLAGALFKINPHWDGERLFQEARKIVGAQIQHITYEHWLPKVLGAGTSFLGDYSAYDPNVDPSVANAFAAAAFRFGHTLIQPMLHRLNSSFQPTPDGPVRLRDAFFAPEKLLDEGGIDPLLRGLYASPAKLSTPGQFLNRELTEHLFAKAHEVSLDLASLNIQRGRDHAIGSYTDYRNFCNLTSPIGTFDDLAQEIKDENLRDGDRFFYRNQGVFTVLQLQELRKTSLARILCDNGDEIDRVQKDVFVYPGDRRPDNYDDCRKIPALNLNMWQECCQDGCSSNRLQTGDFLNVENGKEIQR
uniref:Ig-like domain-containing protein n=1 Tax=Romanomermis culicivorax TaxID=13658 RepID=A0A915ILR4_ROMCU